jgi:hypothetical protein
MSAESRGTKACGNLQEVGWRQLQTNLEPISHKAVPR